MTTSDSPETSAQDLLPAISSAARATHEGGITCDSIATLNAAGLLRITPNPQNWGAHIAPTRILARGCASTAWIVAHTAEANRTIAQMSETAGKDVAAKTDAIAILADAAESINVQHSASEFIISGRWPFVPGAGFADWFVLRGPTTNGPMAFLIPATAVISVPINHRGGLRGCDFHSVTASNLAVPAHRALALPAHDATLQRAAILGAILGGAEGGYHDYLAMTRKRVSGTGGGAVAKMTQVQIRLAEAEAEIGAARDSIETIMARLQSNQTSESVRLARDGAVAARRCLQAITQLVHQMGALGLAEFNPVQRHYRDLRAMATDPRVNWDMHLAAFGRHELGVPEPTTLSQAAE